MGDDDWDTDSDFTAAPDRHGQGASMSGVINPYTEKVPEEPKGPSARALEYGAGAVAEKEIPKVVKRTTSFGGGGGEKCTICNKTVYAAERAAANGKPYHKECFRCATCNVKLTNNFCVDANSGALLCKPHFMQNVRENPAVAGKADSARRESIMPVPEELPATAPAPMPAPAPAPAPAPPPTPAPAAPAAPAASRFGGGGQKCARCGKTVYAAEMAMAQGDMYHKECMRCLTCNVKLGGQYCADANGGLFCKPHFVQGLRASGGKYDMSGDGSSAADKAAMDEAAADKAAAEKAASEKAAADKAAAADRAAADKAVAERAAAEKAAANKAAAEKAAADKKAADRAAADKAAAEKAAAERAAAEMAAAEKEAAALTAAAAARAAAAAAVPLAPPPAPATMAPAVQNGNGAHLTKLPYPDATKLPNLEAEQRRALLAFMEVRVPLSASECL